MPILIEAVRKRFKKDLSETLIREFYSEYEKLGQENGWRYGFAVDALRKGNSLILDEFNKARD